MYLKWVSNNLHCQIVISQVHVQANDESWNIYMKWEISSLIFLVNPLPYCSQQNVGAKFNVLSFSHYVAASTGTNNKCVMFSGFSPTNTWFRPHLEARMWSGDMHLMFIWMLSILYLWFFICFNWLFLVVSKKLIPVLLTLLFR